MFCNLLLIVVLVKIYIIKAIESQYLEEEPNYQKPKLEKNNIVNKGVWVRNKNNEDLLDKANVNTFIFRENSLDVDNLLQNNFDAFGGNYMQEAPFVSAFTDRQKRSSRHWNKRPRKSITGKNIKTRYNRQNNEYENTDSAQTKIISDLKPSLIFHDYPYEVAILSNSINADKNKTLEIEHNETVDFTTPSNLNNNDTFIVSTTVSIDTEIKNTSNELSKNTTSPKRSMKYDFETEIIKKIEFTEEVNKTDENNNRDNKIIDRNVFEKVNSEWHQTAPIPDVNMYKVVPKEPMQKSKPVTERGLLKVISMLTKTFKKIMKQHNEIKDIQSSMNDISDEFRKNTASFASKFQDFDLKYLYLLKFHDKIKEFDEKLASREVYFLNKEKEIARNFKEFENQQKKFLLQQKQFYNIQKLMLAQNEKINSKQNAIAKTQSEISHRQNNFARILKKAKQIYTDSRNPTNTKLSSSITKIKDVVKKPPEKIIQTSTHTPEVTTESVKINLFPITTSNKMKQDTDELILKEKDNQAIDDLVYKYYFNNTFIDSFMRNKILNNFMGSTETGDNTLTTKHKRNDLKTTILLPVLEAKESGVYEHKRKRRWINHHNPRHSKKRREHRKPTPIFINATEIKVSKNPENIDIHMPIYVPINMIEKNSIKENNVKSDPITQKSDPFLTMATSFCNEIHQNANQQTLLWCIEKALRRLQYLETKMVSTIKPTLVSTIPPSPTKIKGVVNNYQQTLINLPRTYMDKLSLIDIISTTNGVPHDTTKAGYNLDSTTPPVKSTPINLQTVYTQYTNPPIQIQGSPDVLHFPDNDELELKLKEYDMEPDKEGNVYFEGSVHASDLVADSESGEDDIMPGLDSNSRVDVDPLTFDLQAKRRAFVRKLNERIKMSLL